MILPSGTGPVLRTYAEAKNQAKCFEILEKVHRALPAWFITRSNIKRPSK
jgi:phosphomannomutase